MRASKNNSGVALVVIVMVVLGLGALGGYVAISVKAARDESASKFTVEKMKRIAIAISSTVFDPSGAVPRHFEDDVGKLPASLDDLTTQGANPACTLSTLSGALSGWCGPYWNNTYTGETIHADGWGQTMTLSTINRRLRSRGPNLADDSGGSDDLTQNY